VKSPNAFDDIAYCPFESSRICSNCRKGRQAK